MRRDVKKAWNHLEKAASKDSLHANFNLGCLHLDSNESKTFSLSKAYEKFKISAVRGHTLASYNVGVMHYLGMGTFKSCQVAL
jgi:TPR repeat protein